MRTVNGRLKNLEKKVREKLNRVIFAWDTPTQEQLDEAERTGAKIITFRWMDERDYDQDGIE